jgi:hypothetical protein
MKFKIYGIAWVGNPSATPIVHVVADKIPTDYYQVTEAVEVELTMLSADDMAANRAFALDMAKVAKLAKLQAELAKLQGE